MPLSDFLYTDSIDDVMAEHVNRLTASLLRGELGEALSISSQLVLADSDYPYLKLTPNAALDVLLPPEASTNHLHVIENGSGSNSLTIKDDSDTTTIAVLRPGQWAMFIPALGMGWKGLGRAAAAGYVLYASTFNNAPADATTYYFGSNFALTFTSTAQRRKLFIPRSGVIARVDVFFNFVAGSNETSSISLRLNDTTDTLLSNAVDLSGTSFAVNATGLNIAVSEGEFIEIKWATPTWVTNPTAVNITAQIFVE